MEFFATLVDKDFFSLSSTSEDFEWLLKSLLYPGCTIQIEHKVYVTVSGLKYFFSSLVSFRACNFSSCTFREHYHSKFLNWLLKFDFDKFIRKACGLDVAVSYTFCQSISLFLFLSLVIFYSSYLL